MPSLPSYVVVTPARDEAQLIEMTIQSMVAQDVLPLRWVIVSDGSTDGTDEIVQRYATEYPWIQLLRMPQRAERHFSGKADAFHAGLALLDDLPYEVVANLDADITFDRGYFSFLLGKLVEYPQLGVVGTPYVDTTNETYNFHYVSLEHVAGACQLFRRRCMEDIGGFVRTKSGGNDTIAVICARMKGWKTRTFTEMHSQHHRALGTAEHSALQARFAIGGRDYELGNHPLWEAFRVVYQMSKRPYILRGLAIGAGYLRCWLSHVERPVSDEFVAFVRREQMQRLKALFSSAGQAQAASAAMKKE
jgi:glycosyltransferase involved in cell wall biosynthesis